MKKVFHPEYFEFWPCFPLSYIVILCSDSPPSNIDLESAKIVELAEKSFIWVHWMIYNGENAEKEFCGSGEVWVLNYELFVA